MCLLVENAKRAIQRFESRLVADSLEADELLVISVVRHPLMATVQRIFRQLRGNRAVERLAVARAIRQAAARERADLLVVIRPDSSPRIPVEVHHLAIRERRAHAKFFINS